MRPHLKFAERLRKLRSRSGLSQTRLATEARVGKGSIYRWEYGYCLPGPDEATRLCAALGISAKELMETEESVKQEVKAEEDVTSISAKRRRKRKGLAEVDLGVNARFSAKLRELRLTARMTQVETAAKLGFSMVKYSRLECGRSGPTWASAVKAAQLFNVTLDTFLQEANPTPLPGRSNNASPESMGIGHRIRFYREMLGLTQLELAMAVDLRASDLSRIEFGLRSLHVSKLVPIANALGISVNKLVVGEE